MKFNKVSAVILSVGMSISFVANVANAGATNVNKGKYCTTAEWAAALDQIKDAMATNNSGNCNAILSEAKASFKKAMPTLSQGGRTLVYAADPVTGQGKIKIDITGGYFPGPINVLDVLNNPPGLANCLGL